MSKKNNKNKGKAYVEALKEEERKREEERLKKQQHKDTRRIANDVFGEIDQMTLSEEKAEKMDVEPAITKKKKKFAKKVKAK